MSNIGMLGLSVARSEIDNFGQKDSKQTLISCAHPFLYAIQTCIQFVLIVGKRISRSNNPVSRKINFSG